MGSEEFRVEFFGERWDVPMLVGAVRVDTPVGDLCLHCGEPVRLGEQGVMRLHLGVGRAPVHRACDLRSVLGGVNHLRGSCSCVGGSDPPDPPGVSRREAAELALAFTLSGEYQARLR